MIKKPVIFLSGGGTMGSVMPLVALWERARGDFDCVWIGSRRGMERAYIEGLGIKYKAITSAKFRRYFDLRTLLAPFAVFLGFWESLYFLIRLRPRAVVVSGSFISVPLVWAGWFFGVRLIAHQEDLKIGLAGRLTIPFVSAVTCAFPETLKEITPLRPHFAKLRGAQQGSAGQENVFCIGNPVREFFSAQGGSASGGKNPDIKKWKAPPAGGLPLVLVLGGGLGSEKINRAVAEIAPGFVGKARILHLTGKNKTVGSLASYSYTQVEGLWDGELAGAMAAADVVVSRAGLSTLGELSFLGKPVILIPLSGAGQEENAKYFEKRNAAVVIRENNLGSLKSKLSDLLGDEDQKKELSKNIKKIFPPDAAEMLVKIIHSVLS